MKITEKLTKLVSTDKIAIRNIRNFWLDIDVDDKDTPFSSGPMTEDGGFRATIYQRNKDKTVKSLVLKGTVDDTENIILRVKNMETGEIWKFHTRRE